MESAKRNHEAVPAFRCNTIVVICYQLVSFILSKFGRCLNGLLADELCTVIFFWDVCFWKMPVTEWKESYFWMSWYNSLKLVLSFIAFAPSLERQNSAVFIILNKTSHTAYTYKEMKNVLRIIRQTSVGWIRANFGRKDCENNIQ